MRFFISILLQILFMSIFLNTEAQPIRIMPVGNSITFDFNSADANETNIRPDGDRISYRYRLYQLLTAAGYNFDFVGSENAGNNFFQNEEMDDNAGFPNITDDQLNHLILTGYNLAASQQEAPGPYLSYYPTDIMLIEIGTNNLDPSPTDVQDVLNSIRIYEPNVIILLARIINRKIYSSTTTLFNDNVQAMVNARNDPRIIMVDLENGAGINYSTDMFDLLHPNQTGYNKMAAKWFEAIDNLNTAPVVTSIPNQVATQGETFSDLGLDAFVSDAQDADNLIHWTYVQQPNSKYTVTLDANRNLHVVSNTPSWYGSETITLKAEDSGGGAFKKSSTTSVVYTTLKANEPPVITSTPITSINEDNNYSYTLTAHDNDGNVLTYSAVQMPAWLEFSSSTHTLSGRPTNDNVGIHSVTLSVSDGSESVEQSFQLTVVNVNDLPVINSSPDTVVHSGETYSYQISATDIDVGDILTYSVLFKPVWLSFTAGSAGGLLYGIPMQANIGSQAIILKVSDGHADVLQGFTIKVIGPVAISENDQEMNYSLYPNPAGDIVYFKVARPAKIRFLIYDLTGKLNQELSAKDTDELQINLSDLPEGIYFYKAFINNALFTGKLMKKD